MDWACNVWKSKAMPRCQFMLWLAFQNGLKTRALLAHRGMEVDVACVLCGECAETVQHLFFECGVAARVWKQVLNDLQSQRNPGQWDQERRWFLRKTKGRSSQSKRIKVLMAAAVYTIWAERNKVLHTGVRSTDATLVHTILNS